jgi:CO/xanthine dehydrogenase FAD-binding subunit
VLNAIYNLPRRVAGAEDAIKGKSIDTTSAEAAGTAAVSDAVPLAASGYNPGNKYMVQIAKMMVKRTVLACK